MQSRRGEDHGAVSPTSRFRRQQRFGTKQGSMGKPRSHPEVSPHCQIEGSGRAALHEGKGSPSERIEHGWHSGTGEKVRQGSPRQFMERKRIHLDNPRKDKYVDYKEYENPRSSRAQSMYRHEYHGAASRVNNKDYVQSGIHSVRGIREKSLYMEDRITSRSHMISRQMAPTSSHGDDDAPVPWASRSAEFRPFETDYPCCPEARREKSCYRESIEHEELQFRDAVEQKRFRLQDNDEPERLCCRDYVEHEQFRFRNAFEHDRLHHQEPLEDVNPSRLDSIEHTKIGYQEPGHFEKVSYRTTGDHQKFCNEIPLSASYSKNIARVPRDDDFPCSSSRVLRCEYTGSYEEGLPLPASLNHSRNSVEFMESEDYNNCDPRKHLRDTRTGKRLIISDLNSNYRSISSKYDEYLDFGSREHVHDDDVYSSENISRQVIPPRARLSYEHISGDHEHKESFGSIVMHPLEDTIDCGGGSLRSMRASTDRIHRDIRQEATLERLDECGIYSPKRKGEHPSSEYFQMEGGINESRDSPASYSGITEDRQSFHLRSGYRFGRDAGPRCSKHDNLEFLRAGKRQRIEEIAMYNPPDAIPSRNYSMEEDVGQHDTRTIFSRDSIIARERKDPYDNGWTDEYVDALDSSRQDRSYSLRYSKGRMYDEPDRPSDPSSDVRFKSRDSLTYQQRDPEPHCKLGVNFMDSQRKSSSLRWNKSYQTKGSLHRQHKIIQSTDSHIENAGGDDGSAPEVFATMPSEESEVFKQLVNEAFLTYSKSLNLYPSLQKRYKELGKAGSLFCIVCGRRLSKEFLDTQRLVNHAFMSRKAGLRAKHLGLHKAICVLMGWNTRVSCDTITWVPEILPDSEALAQKEDLILWPPLVIIHNISMSNNDPESQKVVPVETVASFLRGKGCVDGKMKVALGKPADQSVMLLKFLGTFTGLSSAERISKYFSDNNRGRVQFHHDLSSKSSGSSNVDTGTQGDKIMEQLLYGYLGIADDLDRLDSHTKQRILIKSKKEIQDLADAPVKGSDM